jgi:hypothetical protein
MYLLMVQVVVVLIGRSGCVVVAGDGFAGHGRCVSR